MFCVKIQIPYPRIQSVKGIEFLDSFVPNYLVNDGAVVDLCERAESVEWRSGCADQTSSRRMALAGSLDPIEGQIFVPN